MVSSFSFLFFGIMTGLRVAPAKWSRVQAFAPGNVTEDKVQRVLPSRLEAVADAAAAAAEAVGRSGLGDDVAFGIDMAVREAVANAIKHGNQQDETKTVEVTFTTSTDEFTIDVRDHGTGFMPEAVPDPTDPGNLLKSSGRGIFFMRNFMDTVEWSKLPDGGTRVRMAKKVSV
jgi:serine/threonine-protein kinase RsbW